MKEYIVEENKSECLQTAMEGIMLTTGLNKEYHLSVDILNDKIELLKIDGELICSGFEVLYEIERAIFDASILPAKSVVYLYELAKEHCLKKEDDSILFEEHVAKIKEEDNKIFNHYETDETQSIAEFLRKNEMIDKVLCVDEEWNWRINISAKLVDSTEEWYNGYQSLIIYLAENLTVIEEISDRTVRVNLMEVLENFKTDFTKASKEKETTYVDEMQEFIDEFQKAIEEKNKYSCGLILELLVG